MLRKFSILVLIITVLAAIPAQAQQTTTPVSHKYRTILTISGAGGGFVAGMFVGFAKYDDAVNSDRKVWTTSIVGAAGGAVGGYFLGRFLDRRIKKMPGKPFAVAPVLSREQKGFQASFKF